MFLGENLLPYLVLAMGSALAVGNLLALLMPRQGDLVAGDTEVGDTEVGDTEVRDDSAGNSDAGDSGDLERPPLGRSLLMIAIGVVAALWAIASLGIGFG